MKKTIVAAMILLLASASMSQPPVPGKKTQADTLQTRADTSGRRSDSSLVYEPPPSWGSMDPRLPPALAISNTALALQPSRTLVDAFRSLPGFTLLSPVSEGQYPELFAQGLDGRSIGFFTNGRPEQDPVSGITNPYQLQWMDLDRVEVVTGPRAILYGLTCQGAAVNLVSMDFNAVKPYSRIVYAEGPANFSYSDGTFVQNISRRWNVNLGFQHLGTDGDYSNSPTDQWNIRGRVRYGLSHNIALLMSGRYLSTQTGLNGGIDLVSSGTALAFQPLEASVVNTDAYEKLTRSDLDVTIAGRWLDSTLVFRLSVYTTYLLREYRDEENRPVTNGITIRSDHEVRWSGVTARQEWTSGGFEFLAGALAERTDVQASPNLGPRNENHTALWAKAETEILTAVRASAFGRAERLYGISGGGFGGDVEWSVLPAFRMFGGISFSDRIPNLFERFWTDSSIIRSSAAGLENEHHMHLEAGMEFRPFPSLLFRGAAFHRIIGNPIDLLETAEVGGFPGIEISQSGAKRRITGVETDLSAQFWHILLEGTGTYLASISGGDAPPARLPKLSARGGVYLRGSFFDGRLDLKTGARGTYSSSYTGDRFDGQTLQWGAASGGPIVAWSSLDFVLTAKLGDARIDFLWENLTNVQAFTARYYALPERGIWFRVGWEFLN